MSVLIAAGDWIVNDLQFLGLADGGARAKGCLSNVQRGSLGRKRLVCSLQPFIKTVKYYDHAYSCDTI